MLVYLDTSCLNRPFDDQRQERIHRETEAVLIVLQRIVDGDEQLAWSSVLLTCDDRLIRQAERAGVSLRVLNPVEFVREITDAEPAG